MAPYRDEPLALHGGRRSHGLASPSATAHAKAKGTHTHTHRLTAGCSHTSHKRALRSSARPHTRNLTRTYSLGSEEVAVVKEGSRPAYDDGMTLSLFRVMRNMRKKKMPLPQKLHAAKHSVRPGLNMRFE